MSKTKLRNQPEQPARPAISRFAIGLAFACLLLATPKSHCDEPIQFVFADTASASSAGACCSGDSIGRLNCFTRTLPPGNLGQRFPYDTMRMYYYYRPYNPDHVLQQGYNASVPSESPWLPYSNQIFERVFEQVERDLINAQIGYEDLGQSLESPIQQIRRDKNFEYVDWDVHRESRLDWQQAQQETAEETTSVQNVSQPKIIDANDR